MASTTLNAWKSDNIVKTKVLCVIKLIHLGLSEIKSNHVSVAVRSVSVEMSQKKNS